MSEAVRVDSEAVERLREAADDVVRPDDWHPKDVLLSFFGDVDAEYIAAASPLLVAALVADWERRGQALAEIAAGVHEYGGEPPHGSCWACFARSVLAGEETT